MTRPMQLGAAAVQSQDFANAARWFSLAVAETPEDGQAWACLGQSQCWLGKRLEGIATLRKAGQLFVKKARKRRNVGELLQLASQLQFWDDYQGSLDLSQQAAQIDKTSAFARHLLATAYARLNQNKNALASVRQALKLAPEHPDLLLLQASVETALGDNNPARRRLEDLLAKPLTAELHYKTLKELARLLDKRGEFAGAFAHLQNAAALAKRIPEFQALDRGMVPAMLKTYADEFTPDVLRRWSGQAFPPTCPAPVFVLGFLRSGTTLTQEVLASHSKVFVADEANLLVKLHEEIKRLAKNPPTTPQKLLALDREDALHLRQFYWELASHRYGDALAQKTLVDKTTMNTIDLGIIHCLFPDAKVVFVMRDPRDVCLSAFMQTMTPTPSTVHLSSWEGTARFYAEVMDWWLLMKQRMSLDFLELRYEDAVTQFEPSFRRVFAFLGLEWEPAVAHFHRQSAKKFIASPSYQQVAQPLYASSVTRWKNYQAELSAIAGILNPYVAQFGYETWTDTAT